MALFPLSCVLRGFGGCGVLHVRLAANPCAALLNELQRPPAKRADWFFGVAEKTKALRAFRLNLQEAAGFGARKIAHF
jgi:hypothetical protein